jgi:ribonuclease Z
LKVTILGNNSALPAFGRHPTAQGVSVYGELLLIDCGEGTQIQMQRYGLRWRSMHHIFISHMHGDHYFGLPGLINSMSLLGRVAPLHLYAPAELKPILDAILEVAETVLSYPFYFHALPPGDTVLLVDDPSFSVTCFPVDHRIQCHGFLVERKTRGRKLLPDKCNEYGVPSAFFENLKQGKMEKW